MTWALRGVERPVRLIVSAAALLVVAGCSDGPLGPMEGILEVTASTAGDDIDPDGYTVTVNGDGPRRLSVSGSVSAGGLEDGEATVELSDVADNCTVSGDNPRTVKVAVGGTASTSFEVLCVTRAGSVEVTTSTTGDEPDPDGYTVEIDGGGAGSIGVDETKSFAGVDEGSRTVTLSGVAPNCTVRDNDQSVTVPFDGSVGVIFHVECVSTSGDAVVTTSTAGDDLDPDGYVVTIDPGTATEESLAVGLDETVIFAGRTAGDHTVELSGLATNCTVAGDNPRTVTVTASGASTTFEVSCVSRVGELTVSTSTTGADPDPDGYTITVNPGDAGALTQVIGVNDTVTFTGLDEGLHEVALGGDAPNCTVTGDNPRNVSVPFGDTVSTTFEVDCWAFMENQIVFESDRDDPGGNTSIYVMNADGTDVTRLTDLAFKDSNPHVSPDGTKILFASNRGGAGPDVYVMNADGSGVTNVTGGFGGYNPKWSPLGDKIAWTRPVSGNAEIWVLDDVADPGSRRQLTDRLGVDDLPTWSPDGAMIAFTSDRCGGDCVDPDSRDIWVVPEDGSAEPTRVTFDPGSDGNPSWGERADGTNLISFSSWRDGDEEVYVVEVEPDGSNPGTATNLTRSPASNEGYSSWKPDGTAIAFFSDRDGNDEIYIMKPDGSGQTQITVDPAVDHAPHWRRSP